ncbi:DUF924 family protein [Shewanella violacea]|uniref:DUF924 domain-containing protein n=1 Tax=Shewanella violacea (strain JCM 10179 / CIP 106290 / LMG 19151 / DSS12) TaxID=637905 RepID=D4ZH74_SHEVD|nr:DUF924 family protein [Shewanella violacea]BAJ01023.1 hypothetical protein SVI_1052 [Shewanella violacea DSS12]
MEQFLKEWFDAYAKGQGVETESLCKKTLSEWSVLLKRVKLGELEEWQRTPPGRMALILLMGPVAHLLNDKEAIDLHPKARFLCIEGVELGLDTQLEPIQRRCFYDPLFYSGNSQDRQLLLRLLEGMQSQVESIHRPAWANWYAEASISSTS